MVSAMITVSGDSPNTGHSSEISAKDGIVYRMPDSARTGPCSLR